MGGPQNTRGGALEKIKFDSHSPSQETEFAGTLAVANENLDTWWPHKQAQEQARN